MKKYKIFMVGNAPYYASWFPFPYQITHDLTEANVAWWVGGADVAPWIYGEKEGSNTYVDYPLSDYEVKAWKSLVNKKVLKIGTCKGAQNLSCFNGSKMVQHSTHPMYHQVHTFDGRALTAISTHHQQVLLDEKITGLKNGIDYELLGWAKKLSPFHLNGNDKDYKFPLDYKEPEVVWWPKTMAFAVQSHPEGMDSESDFVKFCQDNLVQKMKESGTII